MSDKFYTLELVVSERGVRLDQFLSEHLKDDFESREELELLSRSRVSKWISEGLLLLDGAVVTKPSYKLQGGERLEFQIPFKKQITLEPASEIVLEIVYEDDSLVVINKAAGLVVHPGAGGEEKTLVHALSAHLGPEVLSVGHPLRPGIVHRLDKDTSGLLVIAKTNQAYQSLQTQLLPPREMKRSYLALVHPTKHAVRLLDDLPQRIAEPIGRHPIKRKEMAVLKEGGKEALTEITSAERLKHGLRLEIKLHTGRTHQIRVHLAHFGLPIVGDPVYNKGISFSEPRLRKVMNRQALHAASLAFKHPVEQKIISFSAAPPEDFAKLEGLMRELPSS